MKVLFSTSLIAALLVAGTARAEGGDDREYLVESPSDEGSSSVAVRATPVLGQSSVIVGGNTVWNYGRFLNAGLGIYSIANGVTPVVEGAGTLNFFYAGFEIDVPLYTYRIATLSLASHLGLGEASYRSKDAQTGKEELKKRSVRIFEPSLAAFAHLTRRSDLGFAVGVRRVSKPDLAGIDDTALDGRVMSVILRGHF